MSNRSATSLRRGATRLAAGATALALAGVLVLAPPSTAAPATCAEDGMQSLEPRKPAGFDLHLISELVHDEVEPAFGDAGSGLHELNCGVVEPVENAGDAVLIPLRDLGHNHIEPVIVQLLGPLG